MKAVLALAVALCVVGVSAFATNGGGVPSVNTLEVTGTNVATATNFVFTLLANPTTYVADGTVNFQVTVNATWSGFLPLAVAPSGVGAITGGTITPFDSSCTTAAIGAAFSVTRDGNFLTYKINTPYQFEAAASYTFTGTFLYPQVSIGTVSFTFTTSSPVTKPAGGRPAMGAFALIPATSVNNVGANLTVTGVVASTFYSVSLVFTAANPQAVAWTTSATKQSAATGTTLDFNVDDFGTLIPRVGSWCGDAFSGSAAAGIDLPTGLTLTIRSVTVTAGSLGSTSYGSGAAFLAGQNTYTITTGETDVTAPTCASALFTAPLTLTTVDVPVSKDFTVTCTDGTGSGVYSSGAYLRAVAGSIVYDFAASSPSATIPPYYTGSVNVIGVWAIDEAGNGIIYGSTGSLSCSETICGEGGSSSSSVVAASIAVVIMCILAVLAL